MGVDYYFETYGEEITFVKEQPNEYIWTLIDADGGLYICKGMRHVNRLAYFVATVPWKEGEASEYIDMLPDPGEFEADEIREWLEPWFENTWMSSITWNSDNYDMPKHHEDVRT